MVMQMISRLPDAPHMGVFGRLMVMLWTTAPNDPDPYGHKHERDHITFITSGTVRVLWKKDSGERGSKVYIAPDWFAQKGEILHKIIPESADAVWWCVFALTDEEEVTDDVPIHNDPTK